MTGFWSQNVTGSCVPGELLLPQDSGALYPAASMGSPSRASLSAAGTFQAALVQHKRAWQLSSKCCCISTLQDGMLAAAMLRHAGCKSHGLKRVFVDWLLLLLYCSLCCSVQHHHPARPAQQHHWLVSCLRQPAAWSKLHSCVQQQLHWRTDGGVWHQRRVPAQHNGAVCAQGGMQQHQHCAGPRQFNRLPAVLQRPAARHHLPCAVQCQLHWLTAGCLHSRWQLAILEWRVPAAVPGLPPACAARCQPQHFSGVL